MKKLVICGIPTKFLLGFQISHFLMKKKNNVKFWKPYSNLVGITQFPIFLK